MLENHVVTRLQLDKHLSFWGNICIYNHLIWKLDNRLLFWKNLCTCNHLVWTLMQLFTHKSSVRRNRARYFDHSNVQLPPFHYLPRLGYYPSSSSTVDVSSYSRHKNNVQNGRKSHKNIVKNVRKSRSDVKLLSLSNLLPRLHLQSFDITAMAIFYTHKGCLNISCPIFRSLRRPVAPEPVNVWMSPSLPTPRRAPLTQTTWPKIMSWHIMPCVMQPIIALRKLITIVGGANQTHGSTSLGRTQSNGGGAFDVATPGVVRPTLFPSDHCW